MNKSLNKDIIKNILSWSLGVIFCFVGLIMIFSNPITGLLYFLIACLLIPPFLRFIQSKLHLILSRNIKTISIVVIFVIIAVINTEGSSAITTHSTIENSTLTLTNTTSTTTNQTAPILVSVASTTEKVVKKIPISSTKTLYGIQTKTSNCVSNQALPDLSCTPGAILPVTKDQICVTGYTDTVRNVPDSLKKQVFQEYGISYDLHSNYEVDHLISLELGGSNDVANLWPESYIIIDNARTKDKLENYLHRQVCNGSMSLTEAQYEISNNWIQYFDQAGLSKSQPATTIKPTSTSTNIIIQPSGKYYTSSYTSAKYYYPESCSAWKSLSASNLKSFDSLNSLLSIYPSRTLSSQCQ